MLKPSSVRFYQFVLIFVLLCTFGQVVIVPALAKGFSAKHSDNKTETKAINNNSLAVYQLANDAVVVRNGFNLNGGRIEGSVRQLLPQSTTLNGQAVVTGSLFVVGTPNVTLNGSNIYNGTTAGTGSSTPTNYNVTLNGNVTLKSVVRHSDAITLNNLPSVPTPLGTRDVSLNHGGSIGDPATLRNLTLNGNVGTVSLPPGTYGNIILNSSNNTLILGTAGQNTTYNLQAITLNASTQIQVLGAVTLNVNNQVNLNSNSTLGNVATPAALLVNISNGGLTVNANSHVYGSVYTPTGTVTLNASSTIRGIIVCNSFNTNANSVVQALSPDTVAPTITIEQPLDEAIVRASSVTVTGQVTDDSVVSVKVNNITATVTGNSYTVNVPLTTFGAINLTAVATDTFGNSANTLRSIQRADATNQAPTVDAGSDQTISLGSAATLAGNVSDDSKPTPVNLTTTWLKLSGAGTVTFSNSNIINPTATFSEAGIYTLKLTANDGQLSTSDLVTITVTAASQNVAPTVNAGSDQVITLPQIANLVGIVTGDNLPNPPAQTSVTWQKISGSGTVNFSSINSLATTATFGAAGTYTLRLTATDGALSASDDVVVVVSAANSAPTVSASPSSQNVTLPGVANITANVQDDGQPAPPGQITVVWQKLSGPTNGTVTFSSATSLSTTATFNITGTYVLRITASDSALQATSDVTVVVSAAAQNAAPLVNAGQMHSVTFPTAVNIAGSYTDDNLPTGGLITPTWSLVSGPVNGEVSFGDAHALTTTADFSRFGTYTLKLAVNDGELTGSANVVITQAPRLQVVVAADIYGFMQPAIHLKAGAYTFTIENRTGQENNFVLSQGIQSQTLTLARGAEDYLDSTLIVGTATLTVPGEPNLVLTITVTP